MTRRKKIALVILLSILIILISLGIYYNNAYRRLKLNLVGVGLGSVTYTSAEIRLIIEVQNPNVLPIYVPSGDFDVYINNQHFCDGNFGSFTVAGNGRTRITVPVTFYITDVPAVLYGLITGGGTVTVTLEGVVHVILSDVPFSTTLYNAKFT
ncbi:LEA type 2 family protein [Candidatus Bathyarchaeota archaeon]|nr:LEA type 2 family protein [Candidatus Bathyarchaeota archaeon]